MKHWRFPVKLPKEVRVATLTRGLAQLNSYVMRYGGMMCAFSVLIEPVDLA